MKRGMEELLRIAAGTAAPGQAPLEPWPRVHALNALRVAYQDASLASETSGYYARGSSCLNNVLLFRSYLLCMCDEWRH